jgi:RhtB (resistance to homoserine/threonine) family protein
MREFLLVAGIHLLAVMSPGPDFAMVIRNSVVYSRRVGVLAALGLGAGILLHVTYSLLGVGLIISQSIVLFNTIKLLGAAYLIYVGIKSLLAKRTVSSDEAEPLKNSKDKISDFQAIKMGFLTNALNPKATLFFLALFTQVIDPSTPLGLKMIYGAEMSIATFAWFAFVALILTHRHVNKVFVKVRYQLEKVFGVVLIALGIKVALGANK